MESIGGQTLELSEKYGRFRKTASQSLCHSTATMGLPHEAAGASQELEAPRVIAGWAEHGAGDGVQQQLPAQQEDEPGPGCPWDLEMRLQGGPNLG